MVITGKAFIHGGSPNLIETAPSENENWMKSITSWSTLASMNFALRYMIAGYKELRKQKFDVLHHIRPFAIGTTFNLLPFLPLAKGVPFVIGEFCSPYSSKVLKGEKAFSFSDVLSALVFWFLKPLLTYLSGMTLKRADAILVTDGDTKALLERQGISKEKIHVIPHGKNKDEYIFDPNKFNKQKIKILIAGHLIQRKRVDLAVRAFAKACETNPNLELQIVGDGLERAKLEELVSALNIEKRVQFTGAVPFKDMSDIFARAHILLHCAKEEMFAHVYIEALASGVIVISTNTIGARSILNSEIGIITSDDSAEISSTILSLADESKKSKLLVMAREARLYFEKNFDLESVILPKVIQIYEKLSK